jgi:hypothetical protein
VLAIQAVGALLAFAMALKREKPSPTPPAGATSVEADPTASALLAGEALQPATVGPRVKR